MSTLLLRLAGPMQSWGVRGRFTRRTTEMQPTKSGVVGLLAAALGRRRTDPIEDLAQLSLGVRVEQSGKLMRDFQTAQRTGVTAPLSYRYYLSDAVFLAAVGGPDDFVQSLEAAMASPVFPLYLGRRAFPPAGQLSLGVHRESMPELLRATPWKASPRVMKDNHNHVVKVRIVRDLLPGETPTATYEDEPVSFDPDRRVFGIRQVVEDWEDIVNPAVPAQPPGTSAPEPVFDKHDPFSYLGGQIVS
ncbi:type I-E CRISPR-associated protein Cas5/CasD [Brevibacterium sp. 50QC2O2]|uniref:type I-E CRISPR-associated protein Cas5/CasD n=1 Tax=Brevibacterium sp. 50QC2O2 TaxID=2968459 RepID=UPI00211B83EA|nr:type I-E CRISPR-associated protein Cas5/CasD [Brevibacterium sp. 50QC2O2]MCQ9387255.1 type I-E CRISPR-associated protein Cas5/CasD [Brevibacterium sp. 50QC2O2]